MKQVIDNNNVPIVGLYKKEDGSLVVKNNPAYQKNKLSADAFQGLQDEVQQLKNQMKLILEKLGN